MKFFAALIAATALPTASAVQVEEAAATSSPTRAKFYKIVIYTRRGNKEFYESSELVRKWNRGERYCISNILPDDN